jgi:cobalt-zinc-cadmium efflux system protein
MHDHRHHDHPHPDPGSARRALSLALVLTLGFAAVEALGGWWAGSLALLSDAGHMLTDSASLALATVAAWLAQRPPSRRHSYGLGRAETLAALLNAVLMVVVVAAIAAAALGRFLDPVPVRGDLVTLIALVGLGVNLGAAWLLMGGQAPLAGPASGGEVQALAGRNINVRGALLHVLGDLLGSVAALVSGLVILHTGWTPVDPLLSLGIALLILISSLRLLRDALHSLLDGVPPELDLAAVGRTMASVEGVRSVHDLHIWSLSAEHTALSAHVVLRRMADWREVLSRLQALLAERFGIGHITLQPEIEETPVAFDPQSRAARPQSPPGPSPGRGRSAGPLGPGPSSGKMG